MLDQLHPMVVAAATAAISGAGGFIGAWSAMKVHLDYLRRDVDAVRGVLDHAHKRIDSLYAEWERVR